MSAPISDMDPELKMRTHRALLSSGATISELNTVRKQLSLVKGGRLVEASRARIVNFLVSMFLGTVSSLLPLARPCRLILIKPTQLMY